MLYWAREGTFKNCLIIPFASRIALNVVIILYALRQFLEVSCNFIPAQAEKEGMRGEAPLFHYCYALRLSSIDLIWPIARVGLSPFGHTLTQFMMLWQRNTLNASLKPSRRLSVSVSRLSIRKR